VVDAFGCEVVDPEGVVRDVDRAGRSPQPVKPIQTTRAAISKERITYLLPRIR